MRLKRMVRLLAGISFILFISTPVFAESKGGEYKVFRPAGPGPHPAVLLISGCFGFKSGFAPKHYTQVAEKLQKNGYVVVFVDFLELHGKEDCMGLSTGEAAKDLVEAGAWLKSQPSIDPNRIAAIGWSFGGNAVLVAINEYKIDQLNFSRAIVYYPTCGGLWRWKAKIPVLMLLAAEDTMARSDMCQDAANDSANINMVRMVIYEGALHCFDQSELPPEMFLGSGKLGYNKEAASAAWGEVERFLQAGN